MSATQRISNITWKNNQLEGPLPAWGSGGAEPIPQGATEDSSVAQPIQFSTNSWSPPPEAFAQQPTNSWSPPPEAFTQQPTNSWSPPPEAFALAAQASGASWSPPPEAFALAEQASPDLGTQITSAVSEELNVVKNSTPSDWVNQFARGATSDGGIYSMLEGAARLGGYLTSDLKGVITAPSGKDAFGGDWEADFLHNQARIYEDYSKTLQQDLPVSQKFQESLVGGLVAGFGQLPASLATFAIPGFGPVAAVGGVYNEAFHDAITHGATPAKAHEAALYAVPSSALDIIADKFIIGKILKPLKGKLRVKDLVRTAATTFASGSITEGVQQAWLNATAYLTGYDPNRKLDDDVVKSFIIGGIVDASTSTAGQAIIPKHGQATDPTTTEASPNAMPPSRRKSLASVTIPHTPTESDPFTATPFDEDTKFAPPEYFAETPQDTAVTQQDTPPLDQSASSASSDHIRYSQTGAEQTPNIFHISEVLKQAQELRNRQQRNADARKAPRKRGKSSILEQIARARSNKRLTAEESDALIQFVSTLNDAMLEDTAISLRGVPGASHYDFAESLVTLFTQSEEDNAQTGIHELIHSLTRFLPESEVASMRKDYTAALTAHIKQKPSFLALVGRYTLTPSQYAEYAKFATPADLKQLSPIKNERGDITSYKIHFTPENYRFVMLDEWVAEKMADLILDKQAIPPTTLGKLAKILKSFLATIKARFGFHAYEKFYEQITNPRKATAILRDNPLETNNAIFDPWTVSESNTLWSQSPTLSPEQLTIAKSPEFKAWAGDWEAVVNIKALDKLKPVEIKDRQYSKEEAEAIYKSIKSVQLPNGKQGDIVNSIFGKISRHKNSRDILKVIPKLKELIEGSHFAYFENERNPEKHGNIVGFNNFVNKVKIGNEVFFVRFSFQHALKDNHQLHNAALSEVEITKATAETLHSKIILHGDVSKGGFVDKNLAQWISDVNGSFVKISLSPEGIPLPSEIDRFLKQAQEQKDTIRYSRASSSNPETTKERKFSTSVQNSPNVGDPVKAALGNLFYSPQSNDATVVAAKERINRNGIDEEFFRQLNPDLNPTAIDVAVSLELASRLEAQGRPKDAAELYRATARRATTQGQAIQALAMLSRLSPTGIELTARRAISTAIDSASPEIREEAEQLSRIEKELEKVNHDTATTTLQEETAKSLGIDPAKVDLGTTLREIRQALTQHSSQSRQIAAVKRILESVGAANPSATAAEIVQDYYNAGITTKSDLVERVVKATGKNKLRLLLDRIKNGDIDDSSMFRIIAKELGIPYWSEDQSTRVRSIASKLLAETDPERKFVLAARMWDVVHESIPVSIWTKVNSISNMALLLNPKTTIRNVGGNLIFMGLNLPADAMSSWVVDPLASIYTGKRTQSTLAIGEAIRGLAQPAYDFANGMQFARTEGMKGVSVLREGVSHMIDIARISSQGKFDYQDAHNISGKVFSNRIMRMLEDTLTISLAIPDRAFRTAAFRVSLANQMDVAKRNGETLLAPDRDMLEKAMFDASYATFQEKNYISQTFKRIRSALNAEQEFGLGTVIFRFVQVPGSIAAKGIEFSPIGFINSLYQGYHLFKGKDTQRELVRSISRAAVGSGLAAAGYFLSHLGIMSSLEDDDRDLAAMQRASGLGKFGFNFSELKRRILSGDWFSPARPPLPGDVVYCYAWLAPLSMPLAMGAEIQRQVRKNARNRESGISEAVGLAGLAAIETIEDQPLLTGLSNLSRNISLYGTAGGALASATDAPSQFVPTLVKQINQAMTNKMLETSAGSLVERKANALVSSLPLTSSLYPVRYDLFGQAQERFEYGGNSIVNVFLNPATAKVVKSNPAAVETLRIAALAGNDVIPKWGAISGRERTLKLPGMTEGVELTNEQISAFRHAAGDFWLTVTTHIVANPAWSRLPAEVKAKALAEVVGLSGQVGKMTALKQGTDPWRQEMREKLKQGLEKKVILMQSR